MPHTHTHTQPPKVSILIPVYNVEKYLRKCLDSAISQTLKDIEIVVVNDGSTDSCPRIVDEYAAKDNRIIAVHQENMGICAARNAALNIARGKYIGFVDSDDWIDAEMYEIMARDMEENNVDIVRCEVNTETEYERAGTPTYHKPFEGGKILLNNNDRAKLDVGINIWNKLYRREIIENYNIRACIADDISFVYKYLGVADSIWIEKKILYNYLERKGSIMHNTRLKIKGDQTYNIRILDHILNFYIKNNIAAKNSYFLSLIFETLVYRASNRSPLKNSYESMKLAREILDRSKLRELSPLSKRSRKLMLLLRVHPAALFAYLRLIRPFLRWLFWSTNGGGYKIITILGVKIKFPLRSADPA